MTRTAEAAAPRWAEMKGAAAVDEMVELVDALTEQPAVTMLDVQLLLDAADMLMSALYRAPEAEAAINHLGDPLWNAIGAAHRAVRECTAAAGNRPAPH